MRPDVLRHEAAPMVAVVRHVIRVVVAVLATNYRHEPFAERYEFVWLHVIAQRYCVVIHYLRLSPREQKSLSSRLWVCPCSSWQRFIMPCRCVLYGL